MYFEKNALLLFIFMYFSKTIANRILFYCSLIYVKLKKNDCYILFNDFHILCKCFMLFWI